MGANISQASQQGSAACGLTQTLRGSSQKTGMEAGQIWAASLAPRATPVVCRLSVSIRVPVPPDPFLALRTLNGSH